jgi:hypothetical protein
MICRHRQPRPDRSATTTVEMALVISCALMLLFGVIEYARFLFFLHVAGDAAREGARFAVVHTGDGTAAGTTSDKMAPTDSAGNPTSGATVCGVTNYFMNGADSNLTSGSYAISVFNANPATGAAIGGTSWNSAGFGGAIAVQINGTYQFMAASLIQMSSATLAVKVTSMMSSEGN